MTSMPLASYIDHTLLKPEATPDQIRTLCIEAKENGFKTVCISPQFVGIAKNELLKTEVGICTVIGFPLGASTTETKVFETINAIKNGATEIDMVISIGKLIAGLDEEVLSDISQIVQAAEPIIVKVILETALLNKDQIAKACKICSQARAKFVKTSTGFSSRGASLEDIEIMKKNIDTDMMIKASGGIRDLATAQKYISAGVSRIGTSSGVEILNGVDSNKSY